MSAASSTPEILDTLERSGLLLKQDKRLPSVITLLAGGPLSSSWWAHRDSRRMFRVLSELAGHEDVLLTKLLLGKDTFVHRALWPALLAVAQARAPWQMRGLTAQARTLLARTTTARAAVRASGAAVRELERRLLVHATEVHTASGRHELQVDTWGRWARAAQVIPLTPRRAARAELERCAHSLGAPPGALPWS